MHEPNRCWVPPLRVPVLAAALLLGLLVTPAGTSAARLSATLEGRPIALHAVARYPCHDRDYPLIRCFRTGVELEADEAATTTVALASQQLLSPFVRWYQNANYSGAFFDAYDPYPDLSVIGWANQISSFKPANGGHPIWFQGPNYTGTMWDWGTSAQANLGNADNRIVSVQKG
jgi:hypothetical protein